MIGRVWWLVVLVACGSKEPSAPPPAPPSAAIVAAVAPQVRQPSDRIHHHRSIVAGIVNGAAIDVSPNGSLIVAGGESGGVVIVDRASRKVLHRIAIDQATSAAFSADGARIGIAARDAIHVYDTATAKLVTKLALDNAAIGRCGDGFILGGAKPRIVDSELHDRLALAVEVHTTTESLVACRDRRAAVVREHVLYVFESQTGTLVKRVSIDDGDENSLDDLKIGEHFIAAMSNNGTVSLFTLDGAWVATAPHIAREVHRLAFGAGDLLAAGTVLLAIPSLAIRARIPGRYWRGEAVAFTPDGAWLVIARTSDLDLLDVAALPERIDSHDGWGNSLAIDPSATYLASGSNGRVLLWKLGEARPDVELGPLVRVIEAHPGGVSGHTTVAFSADGSRLFSAGNGTIAVWDVATGNQLAAWVVDEKAGDQIELAVDAEHLVALASTGVFAYDQRTYKPAGVIAIEDGDAFALHPDRKHVAVTASGGSLAIYDLASGKLVAERPRRADVAEERVAITPDGSKVLELAPRDLTEWSWPKLTKGATFESAWIAAATWSPDGLVWGSWDGQEVGVLDQTLHPHWKSSAGSDVAAVAFDSKRHLVYSTGTDRSIHIWDATTGKLRGAWLGEGENFSELMFSRDHKELITYQPEVGELRLWNLTTFEQTALFHIHLGAVHLDGDRLIVLDQNGELQRWQRSASTWTGLPSWKPPGDPLWRSLGITADGATAYISDETGTLLAIDTASAKVASQRATKIPHDTFGHGELDPGSARAIVHTDNALEVWDLAHAKRLAKYAIADDDRIDSATFIGDEIAFGTEQPRRWSLATGKTRPDCNDAFHTVLGFSEDGTRTVWLGDAIRVRSTASCEPDEHVLYAAGDEQIATVDGDRLIVGAGGRIVVWDLKREEPIAVMRALRGGAWSTRTIGHYTAPAPIPLP